MRIALVLVPEVGRATGPDLTRYFVVCAGSLVVLVVLAWVFRRFLAERLKVRAAKRSLQVLDVLPLSGKQKLVVVRCYDRSFLLGVGEKEVRAIAELDGAAEPQPSFSALDASSGGAPEAAAQPRQTRAAPSFSATLEGELTPQPKRPRMAAGEKGILA